MQQDDCVHELKFSFDKPFKYRQLLQDLGYPVLFIGAETCFYHRQVMYREADVTALTPTVADVSLGTWEDSIFGAAQHVIERSGAKALVLYITCLVDFLGVDYQRIAATVSERYGVACYVYRDCRICTNRRPFPVSPRAIDDDVMRRRIFPSPDPPALLCSILREVGSRGCAGERRGLLVACGAASIDAESDLRAYMQSAGEPLLEAYRLTSLDDLDAAARVRAVLVMERNMVESTRQLAEKTGAELLYLPQAFDIPAVDEWYRRLEEVFGVPARLGGLRERARASRDAFYRAYRGARFRVLLDGLAEPWTFVADLMASGILVDDAGGTPLTVEAAHGLERDAQERIEGEAPELYRRMTSTRAEVHDRMGPESQWAIRAYLKQTNGWKLEDVVRGRAAEYDPAQDFELIQQRYWGYRFIERFFACACLRVDNDAPPVLESGDVA